MKFRFFQPLSLTFVLLILFVGCSKHDDVETPRKQISPEVDLGFSDPLGVFLLNEGNLGSADGGSLHYITPQGNIIQNIFQKYNAGLSLGKVTQDLKFSNGKGYIIAQNDSRNPRYTWTNGLKPAGRLVVFDLKSMKLAHGYESKLRRISYPTTHIAPFPDGQSLLISSATSENITRYNPQDIYAPILPIVGAEKLLSMPMIIVSDTLVFAVSENNLYLLSRTGIAPSFEERIVSEHGEKITGLAKDGNERLWIATHTKGGESSSEQGSNSKSRLYRFNTKTLALEDSQELTLGELTSVFNRSSISAKGDTIYYNNGTKIYRHIYNTSKSELMADAKSYVSYTKPIPYGTAVVHPRTGRVYYNLIKSYAEWKENSLLVFDFSLPKDRQLHQNYQNITDFPAGVFFIE